MGSLELSSRNIVSGAVRVCFSCIYSLFRGFGLDNIMNQCFGTHLDPCGKGKQMPVVSRITLRSLCVR